MVLLALTCAIVDKAGSLFGVEIDDGAKVSELKKAIHKKKMYPFPVDELQLFPAKTEGGANDKKWLLASSEDAEKLEKGEKTALIADLTEKDHELQTENHLVDEWNKMDPPLPRYIHVLVVLPGHALESENKRTRKRMECEVLG
nr:CRN effector protein [Phytophthora cinnamomi]